MVETKDVPGNAPRTTLGARIAGLIGGVVGTVYLLNPTAGIFELLPDNLPFVGNLDEAAATALLIYGLRVLFRRSGPGGR